MLKDDGTFFREIESNCWDVNARLEDMKRTKVDFQVLCTIPVMFSYWAKPKDCLKVSEFLNDDLARTVKENPDHFAGLGTIPMQSPELAVKEFRRCVEELGLLGVQIGSHVNNLNLDDPSFYPIWSLAEELQAPILIHPWDMVGKEMMKKYWMPWLVGMPAETTMAMVSMIMGGVFEKFPNIKVCFAHGGGQFPFTIGRIVHGFEARPDLCQTDCKINPRDFIGKFWVDSITHDVDALDFLVKVMGEDKVILGSDAPFPLGEDVPGKILASSQTLTDTQKAKIQYYNALDFLGLSKSDISFL